MLPVPELKVRDMAQDDVRSLARKPLPVARRRGARNNHNSIAAMLGFAADDARHVAVDAIVGAADEVQKTVGTMIGDREEDASLRA